MTGEHLILYKDGVQDYEPLNGDLPWKPLASLGAAVDKVPPPGYFDEEYASVKKEEEAKAVKLEPGARWTLPKATGDTTNLNRNLYFYAGDAVLLNGKKLGNHAKVKFRRL